MLIPTTYNYLLKTAKTKYKYQTMTFRLLTEVYPFLESYFLWGDLSPCYRKWYRNERLLWFRKGMETCLVDIPRFDLWRFRCWLKRRERAGVARDIVHNESNIILQQAQLAIEREIDRNNQMMRQAVVTQQQILQRLSPFEEDYIKSQVNVEV